MLAVLLASTCQQAKAQSVEPYNYNSTISPSPEVFAISKYGGVTPSLYTGAMEYSIPLFTYSDEDFTLPISLDYHFDGYRPAEHSGTVGYGWSLNCGGVITREVRGIPDETDGADSLLSGYFYYVNSYMRTYQNRIVVNSRMRCAFSSCITSFDEACSANIFSDIPSYGSSLDHNIGQGDKYETAADVFHYNFLGHTGSFMMQEDGSFKTFDTSDPYGEVSVEYEMRASHDVNLLRLCKFTIKTGEGYKYVFGASEQSIEYNSNCCKGESSATVAAWKLDTIVAPNGNNITLSYDSNMQRSIDVSYAYTPSVQAAAGYEADPGWLFFKNIQSIYGSNVQSEKREAFCTKIWSPLSTISVNGDTVVELIYSEKEHDECSTEHYEKVNYLNDAVNRVNNMFTNISSPHKLSQITVKNRDDNPIESFNLTYTCFMNKFFLSSVSGSKKGRYYFSYNNPNSFDTPANNTTKIDYWGYYNNRETTDIRSELSGHLNLLFEGSFYDQLFIESLQPDVLCCSVCGLVSVTYPTGGTTQIQYEGNTASYYFDRAVSRSPYFAANSENYAAGGVRVKKITNSDGNTQRTEEYFYQNSRSDTSSSGYVLDTRCYGLYVPLVYYIDTIIDGVRTRGLANLNTCGFTSDCNLYPGPNPHIGYKTVLVKHPDNSMTEYSFAVGPNYIDDYSINDRVIGYAKTFVGLRDLIYGYYDSEELWLYNLFLPPLDDNSCMRGKLLREVIYDADGHTMRRNTYQYSKELVCETTAYYNMLINFVELTQKHYQCLGTSELEEEYLGNGVISRSRTREYNQSGQLKSETSTSGGESAGMHYWYVHEADSTRFPALRSDAVRTRRINDSTCVVSSEHYTYGANGGDYRPTMIESYIITPTKYTGSAPSVSTGRTAECRVTTLAYDPTYRRLTTVSMPGGAYVQYSWDGTYDHLVGKTVNGTGNTSSYQWKDMVGLTGLTEPSGQYHIYSYDTRNRLKAIKDGNRQEEIEYEYNIVNE